MGFACALPVILLLVSPAAAGDLQTLVEWMTGSFSSAAQAEADERYYDIRLEMVPIWTDRDDARWLYVEQAAASLDFAGAFRDPARCDELAPEALSVREGCAVILHRQEDGKFTGSTEDEACQSSLCGASYATSIVTVGPEGIESWDRGFDEDGEQVWGAEAGPYVFMGKGKKK